MSKTTAGYYIEEANKRWLEEKGKEIDRSASWYLDKLLTETRMSGEKNAEDEQQ